MTSKFIIIGVCILVTAAALFLGYRFGRDEGYSQGYSIRKQETAADSHAAWEKSHFGKYVDEVVNQEYPQLQEDYNALVEDYNALRDTLIEVSAMIGYNEAVQYEARDSIHCDSYEYGMGSISTTCY